MLFQLVGARERMSTVCIGADKRFVPGVGTPMSSPAAGLRKRMAAAFVGADKGLFAGVDTQVFCQVG